MNIVDCVQSILLPIKDAASLSRIAVALRLRTYPLLPEDVERLNALVKLHITLGVIPDPELDYDSTPRRSRSLSPFSPPISSYHPEGVQFWVYFIEAVGLDKVKIGRTTDIISRTAGLATHSPVALRLVGLIKDAGETCERELHKRFRTDRLQGEWFRYTSEIKAYIAKHAKIPESMILRPRRLEHGSRELAILRRLAAELRTTVGALTDSPKPLRGSGVQRR